MNVFVKPNEQNRACSSYAMARKRRMKSNVFVKPNEQNRACSSYAMARKRRMKSNDFVKPDEAYKRYCKREQRKFTFNLSSAAISYPMSDNEICICSWREIALWKRKKSCTYKNLFVT